MEVTLKPEERAALSFVVMSSARGYGILMEAVSGKSFNKPSEAGEALANFDALTDTNLVFLFMGIQMDANPAAVMKAQMATGMDESE